MAASIRRQLVAGNRIFAQHGILDAYGHISVRDPENPQRFIMSRARAPELVTEEDLQDFDLEGKLIDPNDKRGPYNERFIHAAIYDARTDVQCVTHAHTPSVIPFGVTDIRMRAIFHIGGIIGANVPVWDIADEFGVTSMLVTNIEQGRSLARALGGNRTVLMRGHGCAFAGNSIQEVTRHGVYMDMNAKIQTNAILMSGGNVKYLSEGELSMRLGERPPALPGQIRNAGGGGGGGREWEAWLAQVGMIDVFND